MVLDANWWEVADVSVYFAAISGALLCLDVGFQRRSRIEQGMKIYVI